MIGLYLVMVAFNLAMLVLSIMSGMPLVNLIVWGFATCMWGGAAFARYRSRKGL